MILTQKINIDCNDDALLKIITKITDWTPWVITRKDKLGHINFNYNGEHTNCGMYSAFLSDYWDLLLSVSPDLEKFKPNLKNLGLLKLFQTEEFFLT